jgi:hypothetical protein
MCCWHNWGKSKEEARLLNKLKAMAGISTDRPNDGLSKKQRRRLKRAAAHAEFVAAVAEKVQTVGA